MMHKVTEFLTLQLAPPNCLGTDWPVKTVLFSLVIKLLLHELLIKVYSSLKKLQKVAEGTSLRVRRQAQQ